MTAASLLPVCRAPGPPDLSATPNDGPAQPVLQEYPSFVDGTGRKRSFLAAWYQAHSWLEYSQSTNSAFCFACRHFRKPGYKGKPPFVSEGFQTWKKAHCKDAGLTQHEGSNDHLMAMVDWDDYKKIKPAGGVQQMQSDEYRKQVSENRHYVKTVAEVLLLTATQNMAQRGHKEAALEQNPGNFKKILNLVVKHDASIAARFVNDGVVTRYTGKDIQNEIFETLAALVRDQIIDEVRSSVYFSVLADETKDVSKKEQISIVLRYLYRNEVRESFMEFKAAHGLDAQSLSQTILNCLQSYGLDTTSCLVGQCYDGASVMSGIHKGVQSRVRECAPMAVYTHCYAHRLNLVLVDVCKSVRAVAGFFALLERLYVFVSGSVVHDMWMKVQRDLYPDQQPRQLQRLSDTRWACRVIACRNIRDRLEALVQLLLDIIGGSDSERAVDARGLLSAIDLKFVLLLNLFCDLLGNSQSLSAHLQSASVDISKAVELVHALIDYLKERRDCRSFVHELFVMSKDQIDKCGIAEQSVRLPSQRRRKIPAALNSSVVMETVGHPEQIDTEDLFRQNAYFPVLDCMINELENRFSENANAILIGIQALTPSHATFLDAAYLKSFAELYRCDMEDISHELHQLKRLLHRSAASFATDERSLVSLASFLEPYRMAFHELYKLITIALVIPVTSASCERTFSALKLIKTHLRNTMSDERLSNIAVLSIEATRAESIDLDEFVDEFDARHNNRKLALH